VKEGQPTEKTVEGVQNERNETCQTNTKAGEATTPREKAKRGTWGGSGGLSSFTNTLESLGCRIATVGVKRGGSATWPQIEELGKDLKKDLSHLGTDNRRTGQETRGVGNKLWVLQTTREVNPAEEQEFAKSKQKTD